ncbi:hypothetical protein [Pontibacter sp. G13]|uniref:hypothetical protein n=1 Tax=Pontibacter sp. G13 TaxID=3074898 RepID=UPI002889D3F9|nr:hypothetical protein [Pontibacter sp. G13]WNJ18279.1 hypothetical protein RJD25_25790 [Pontibacter sp. G13]
MRISLVFCLWMIFCGCLFSQTQNAHFNFISTHFERIELPATIDCRDVITEVNPGFEFVEYLDSFPYYSDSTHRLTQAEFDFLFQSEDTLYLHNIWSLIPCCEKSREDFFDSFLLYPGSYLRIAPYVMGFVLWVVDDDGIEKVLYTMDADGQIIDKLPLAFYHRHGSYTEEDGSRGIWWTTKNAEIRQDLSVKTDAGHHNDFQIQRDGKIEEI